MSGTPTFYQLYRRSRYSGAEPGTLTLGRSGHAQREVFAVAALGFALRHEPAFLAHFLRALFKSQVPEPHGCEIRCQDGDKSDLAIVWPGKRVLVVEAKIDADLKHWQNPTKKAFHDGPSGYGVQINRDYRGERERYYAVLAKDALAFPRFPGRETKAPTFLGLYQWGELSGMENPSTLVADLLQSLGCLGIPELHLRSFMKKKLSAKTRSSAEMFTLLEGLADCFKIPVGQDRWDVGDSDEGSHFGVNLTRHGRFKKLSTLIGGSSKIIGWFGYETRKGKPRLSVWFYTEDESARDLAGKFVQQVTQLPTNSSPDSGHAFCITPPAGVKTDDVSWFQIVLGQIAD